jgi:phosphoglycerate dehydrogenase-like enzyme
MIGADELAIIKPGALLVNTARGGLVDGAALSGALDAGRLGGYAADVSHPEPPAPDPTFPLRRTVLTPHVAGLTVVTYREICVRPAEAVVAILTGSSPDPACVYGASTVSR